MCCEALASCHRFWICTALLNVLAQSWHRLAVLPSARMSGFVRPNNLRWCYFTLHRAFKHNCTSSAEMCCLSYQKSHLICNQIDLWCFVIICLHLRAAVWMCIIGVTKLLAVPFSCLCFHSGWEFIKGEMYPLKIPTFFFFMMRVKFTDHCILERSCRVFYLFIFYFFIWITLIPLEHKFLLFKVNRAWDIGLLKNPNT